MVATVETAAHAADRLRSRQAEIEQALLARVYGIADPTETGDPGYLDGFRTAAAAAVDFAVETLLGTSGDDPPIPPVFLLQARLAARNRVRLDIVLRRYTAGHAILIDFLFEEVEQESRFTSSEVRSLLASTAAVFDRLLLSVGDEYAREAERFSRNVRERSRVDRVERLIAGELAASDLLDYRFDLWHIGLVLDGADARTAARDLAREADRRLLAVEPRVGTLWAWLGGKSRIEAAEVAKVVRNWRCDMKIALGEPGQGIGGWRLSHQQALVVFPLAEGAPVALARYAEKGILASIQKDQVLSESLRKLYLEPLTDEKDGEDVLGETLRAYFAAECSTSSAASALQVHRQTVSSRLRAVEEKLGRSISECFLELNLALTLAS